MEFHLPQLPPAGFAICSQRNLERAPLLLTQTRDERARLSSATRPLTQPHAAPDRTAWWASQCGKCRCPLRARFVGKASGLLKHTTKCNGVGNRLFKNGGLLISDVLLGFQITSLMPHLHLDLPV